jgi:hypothetical protein
LVINVFVVGRRYLRFRDREDLGGFLRNDSREVYQVGNGKRTVIGPDRPRYSVHQIHRKVNLSFSVHAARSEPEFAILNAVRHRPPQFYIGIHRRAH